MVEKLKVVRFNWDYTKLDRQKFATLRRAKSGNKKHKYVEGDIYKILTPNKIFKARCIGVHVEKICNISDEFLKEDTDSRTREEALDILSIAYPDIDEDTVVLAVFFEKVIE